MKNIWGSVIGITLAVGIVVAVVKFLEWLEKQEDSYTLSNFDDLVKAQKTIDELNAREITDWIKEIKKTQYNELTYIIAYPTKEVIEKYRLVGFPEIMDKDHNVIFIAIKKDSYVPVKIQMVSFGSINEQFACDLFNGEDYAVVEE